MSVLALFFAAVLANAPAPAPSARTDLTVVIEGVRDAQGLVRLDVCRRDTFLRADCEVSTSVKAQAGVVTVRLPAVPEGEYAIQAYHDRDGDGSVSRNPLGIPTEALGFSRAPPLGLHGPSFARSAFVHAADQTVTVRLRKLL